MTRSRRSFLASGLALPVVASATRSEQAPPTPAKPPSFAKARSSAPELRYKVLGKTGLKVTTVGFGCMITSDGSVVERAMQAFGAMGLSPDTPLAQFWTWGRAMHLMDGPDEVHLRTVARHELNLARARQGASAAYFTTPEHMDAPPRIR